MTLSWAVLALIGWYGREVSPHKGFRCAHAQVSGGPSCSAAVASIVAARGVLAGWRDIRAQFAACRAAGQVLARRRKGGPAGGKPGRGSDCTDLSCDACDLSCLSVHVGSDLWRALLRALVRGAWHSALRWVGRG